MSPASLKIAFVLPNLEIGGGNSIALANARHAVEAGLAVSVVLTSDLPYDPLHGRDGLAIVRLSDTKTDEFDVAIASWWRDVLLLPQFSARRYVHFIQGPEDLFYDTDDAQRVSIGELYRVPIAAISLSHWLKNYLRTAYGRGVNAVAHPGIDKTVFTTSGPTFSSREDNRLRVLVEGPLGVGFKGVVEALRLSRSIADETWLLTSTDVGSIAGVDRVFSRLPPAEAASVYRSCDVLLKLSTVEGFGLPPLEMFHCGGTSIAFGSTGVTDFAEHGRNSLIAPAGDFRAAGRLLADVKSNRELLRELQAGALETSAHWPTQSEAAQHFVETIQSVAAGTSEADGAVTELRRLDAIQGVSEQPRHGPWNRLLHNRLTRSLRYSVEVVRRR